MTTSHTPGPWRVVVNCNDYEVRPYLIYAGEVHVASIERDDEERCESNAALIRTAPAVLEALRLARSMLPDRPAHDPERSKLDIIDRAIEEATEGA